MHQGPSNEHLEQKIEIQMFKASIFFNNRPYQHLEGDISKKEKKIRE
jgi:hypothetical protein